MSRRSLSQNHNSSVARAKHDKTFREILTELHDNRAEFKINIRCMYCNRAFVFIPWSRIRVAGNKSCHVKSKWGRKNNLFKSRSGSFCINKTECRRAQRKLPTYDPIDIYPANYYPPELEEE